MPENVPLDKETLVKELQNMVKEVQKVVKGELKQNEVDKIESLIEVITQKFEITYKSYVEEGRDAGELWTRFEKPDQNCTDYRNEYISTQKQLLNKQLSWGPFRLEEWKAVIDSAEEMKNDRKPYTKFQPNLYASKSPYDRGRPLYYL